MKSATAGLVALVALLSFTAYAADFDGDGLADSEDPCPTHANPTPTDTSGDGIPDDCQCGDADGNGELEALDGYEITMCVLDSSACTLDVSIADADNNGVLEMADYGMIAQVIDGERPSYELTCLRRPEGTAP